MSYSLASGYYQTRKQIQIEEASAVYSVIDRCYREARPNKPLQRTGIIMSLIDSLRVMQWSPRQ